MSTSSNRIANRLIHTESPYLRQHAYNPVDWYPWGDEALQKAQKEDKLLIVSIGYSACHWCHVMERESFENASVAALMNKHFVSIKVDREERPDLDNLYMQAATLVSGRGGWPLNIIALPDGRPIYGGTYYPPEQWSQLLTFFHKAYQDDRDKLLEQAKQISQGIRQMEVLPHVSSDDPVTPKWHDELVANWLPELDKDWGGAAGAPKFPMPANWAYLLAYQHLHGDDKVRSILSTTLDRMAWGGLYDPVGGGFARYSTDARWHVPHFEKMLYDNAQLLTLYSQAFSVTANHEYARVVVQTVDFLNRELRHPHGAYYCALDADSEGEEGKFYVFTHQEWSQVLGADANLMAAIYSITKAGNWEHGQNVLFRTRPLEAFAKEQDLSLPRFLTWHDEQMEKLRSFRDQRERPGLDDKILTSWNALAIAGLCSAYDALGKKQYLADAEKTYRFLRSTAWQGNGAVWRNLKGKPAVHGFLDDHALLTWAAIQLYHTTFDPAYLNDAQVLVEYTLDQFSDPESPFFYYTPSSQETIVTRQKEMSDNVIPASNSVIARVLYRLGHLLDRKKWIERAEQMLTIMKPQIARQPRFFANWAMLGLEMAHKPYEVAIVGPESESLRKELAVHYLPNAWLLGAQAESKIPLLEGKYQTGKTLVYVCRDKTCRQPVTTVEDALIQLGPSAE